MLANKTAENLRHDISVGAAWGTQLDAPALVHLTSHALKTDDDATISTINQQFHRMLVAASGSDTLNREMDKLLA